MLHLLVGPTCNNNCSFCMEDDRVARQRHVVAQGTDDLLAMMRAYPMRDEVLFTCGEPTLNPSLVDYVRAAKELGFATIGLISNGRRLGYGSYAEGLLRAGLNRVHISIHAHAAKLHDSLTRTPGSFVQTRAGLDTVLELRRRYPCEVRTGTTLTARNLMDARAVFDLVIGLGVDLVVFNILMPYGRGAEHFELMPRYPQAVRVLRELASGLSASELLRLRVEDLAPCLASGLPAALQGALEVYTQFEPLDSGGSMAGPSESSTVGTPHAGGGAFYVTSRAHKEAARRIFGPSCARCRSRAACSGVWPRYVEAFGWDDFVPL